MTKQRPSTFLASATSAPTFIFSPNPFILEKDSVLSPSCSLTLAAMYWPRALVLALPAFAVGVGLGARGFAARSRLHTRADLAASASGSATIPAFEKQRAESPGGGAGAEVWEGTLAWKGPAHPTDHQYYSHEGVSEHSAAAATAEGHRVRRLRGCGRLRERI